MAKNKVKIINIVGARPNFIKISPIVEKMKQAGFKQILLHTGQHYDFKMSRLFFNDLALSKPDINLGVGSGSHGEQTAEIMRRAEPIFWENKPDLVLVVGDVNSTLACALTASKMGIRVAHVEAGLRSFDRSMPEEINRVLTDAIADYLFVSEQSGMRNLRNEGIQDKKIFFVGNTMIDTLIKHRAKAEKITPIKNKFIKSRLYGVLTLHRPNNVESEQTLRNILEALKIISEDIPIIFPVHPRTLKQIKTFRLINLLSDGKEEINRGINMIPPIGYLKFLSLMVGARIVFTDSGGIQEETTFLGIPCITLRENTERPVTLISGTNMLAGVEKNMIIEYARKALNGYQVKRRKPKLWDGRAAERIVKILAEKLNK